MGKVKGQVEVGGIHTGRIETERSPRPTASGGATGTTSKRREVKGSTILDATVPVAYGQCKVDGLMAARRYWGGYYSFIWVLAFGEQSSVDEVWIGGRKVYPATGATGYIPLVMDPVVWTGDGTTISRAVHGIPWILDREMAAWEKEEFGRYACFSCRIDKDKNSPDLQGQINVSAIVGGQLVDDFRTGSPVASTNPIVIGHEIQTAEHWRDLPSSAIDDADSNSSWWQAADYSDEVMADATPRWEFNGAIATRDSGEAMELVLKHAIAEEYYNASGDLCVRHDGLPPAEAGTWSASASQVVTEDGADDGEALSVIAAGDWVSVGDSYGKVISIADDNTFTLDRQITVTSGTLRKLTDIEIAKTDWVARPSAGEIPLNEIPDEVVIRYGSQDEDDSLQYPEAQDVTGEKLTEVRLEGCRSASVARRYSETMQQLSSLQPFAWAGSLAGIGAELEPGRLVVFSTDLLTEQLARVDDVGWDYEKSVYKVVLGEIDLAAYSDGTATDTTPTTYDVADPDPPTALTQTFGEKGDWDSATIFSNPDNISGWTFDSGLAAAYDGTDDETELTLTSGTVGWKRGRVDISSDVDGFNVLYTSEMLRWISGADETVQVNLEYWSGANYAGATRQGAVRITPFDANGDQLWERTFHRFGLTADAYHDLRIAVRSTDPTNMTADAVIGLKRLRGIVWGVQGEPVETRYDGDASHVTSRLSLYSRYSWTPDASAEDTVQEYQLRGGAYDTLLMTVAEGTNDELAWITSDSLQDDNGHYWFGTGGTSSSGRGPYMVTVGPSGKIAPFPAPTQAYEGSSAPPVLQWNRFALSYWWSAQTQAYEHYTTFTYAPSGLIPTGTEDDYTLEFWLNLDGGGLTLRREVPLTTEVAFGPANSKVGEAGFVYTNAASVVYELWARNKYTGKRTQMTEAGYAANTGMALPPNTPTLAVSNPIHTITNDHTDVFGVVTSTKILVLSWTNAADGGTTTDHYEIETRDSAVPAVITRHDYSLPVNSTGQATSASWSDNLPATFPDEFVWPSGHNQMRVIAVGPLGEETESNWGTPTVTAGSSSSGGSAADLNTQPKLVETTSGITTGYPKWIKVFSTTTRYAKLIAEIENGLYGRIYQWSERIVVHCDDTTSAPAVTWERHLEDATTGTVNVAWDFQVWYDSATGDTELWARAQNQHARVAVKAWKQYHWDADPDILTDWETAMSSTGPTAAGTYSKVWDTATATPNFDFDAHGGQLEVDGTPLISRIQDASDVTITGLAWGDMLYWDGSVWRDISRYQIDNDAFHKAVGSEISALTEKATPVSADLIVIEDSAASNAKKKVQIGNLPSGGGGSAPKTTSAVSQGGTCSTSGSTEQTLVNVSSGPYIIHLIANTDPSDSGYIELVVDGTTLIPGYSGGGTLYAPSTVILGAESPYYPCPVFVRSSFSVKGLDNGGAFFYRIVYQAVSIS